MKKILLLLCLCSFTFAQEAVVVKVDGTAYLNSTGTWQKLVPEMALETGNSVTTEDGSTVLLKFTNGHTLKILENSIFSIKENTPNLKDMDLWLGEIGAKIEKLPPSEKFFIRTPAAVCAVRGTKFNVAVDESKKTNVYVEEGTVGVMDNEGLGEEVFVDGGMMTTVSPGERAAPPVKQKPREKEKEKPPEKVTKEKPEVGAPVIESFKEPEPEPEPEPAGKAAASGFNMNGSIGAVALTRDGVTKVYYEFSMFPEIAIGKLGIGLELVVHFDENNEILKDEWRIEEYPSKIDYIRWGQKHVDPLYFLIGRFRRPVTIGHGLIVNNYSNMAQYPNVKKIGLEFDLDRKKWGLEGMTGDVTLPEVIAARFYFRPLLFTGIPLLRNLKLGALAGSDTDPDSTNDTKDDAVTVIGADAELPLLTFKFLSATVFADIAKMQFGDIYLSTSPQHTIALEDGGIGKSAGLSGKIGFLSYRGEYRIVESNFMPGYFDGHYDLDRWEWYSTENSTMTKAEYYLRGKTKEPVKVGPYVEAWFSFFNLLDFRASYENYNVMKGDPYYPHLIASASLAKLPGLAQYSFEADYDKRGARTWNDIKQVDQNAILTTKFGYSVAPNVTMFVVIRRSYDSAGNKTKSMTAETRMKF
ncbi:MAG: FecR family protein [bacterium]